MLLLQLAYTDHQPRYAIGAIDRKQSVGELVRPIDVAIGELGEERTAHRIRIVRIELQNVEVIGCGGSLVALRKEHAGGEITAGGILGRKLHLFCRRFRGKC